MSASIRTRWLVAAVGLAACTHVPAEPLDGGGVSEDATTATSDAAAVADAGSLDDAGDAASADGPLREDGGPDEDGGPRAEGIDGRLADGRRVRLHGSFPAKDHPGPLIWADFEESAAPSPVSRGEWLEVAGELTRAHTAAGSSQALRFDHASSSSAAGGSVEFDSDALYVFVHRYYDYDIRRESTWGPSGFNLKVFRLWQICGSACDYRHNNIYLGYQGAEGGNPRAVAEYTGERTVWGGPEVTPERWLQEEWLYRAGTVGEQDGTFVCVRDGVPQWDARFRMRTVEYPDPYDRLVFDQVSNGTGPGPYFTYHDDVYIDTTWTRVMITDAPTLEASRLREIQIPHAWSSSEIEIEVRQGAHDALRGRYVLVIDEDDTEAAVFPIE